MSSISEKAKPIELKFCRNPLLGPRMVLGYKFSRFIGLSEIRKNQFL